MRRAGNSINIDPEFHPELVDPTAFIAAGVVIRGKVSVGAQSSVWFGTVIRGDTERVTIGDRSNIQDLAVVHSDPGFPCEIGDRVTVGHAAIIHGARVESGALIGIRAVVLNGARIGAGALVAAGAVVGEGVQIPPNSLVMGVPGRVVRELSAEQAARVEQAATHYVEAAERYRQA